MREATEAERRSRGAGRRAQRAAVRLQLSLIEEMLADGRRWLAGDAFTTADLAVYHAMC